MLQQDERHRIRHFRDGRLPPDTFDKVSFRCQGDAANCLERIAGVMDLIAAYDPANWPTDDEWQRVLPAWLLGTFKTYSLAELTRIRSDRSLWPNLSWQLGSWLDLLRDRDWEWWSASTAQDVVSIVVRVQGLPYSSGPLRHLIEAAGGHLAQETR